MWSVKKFFKTFSSWLHHLLSLYSFAFNSEADLPALISADKAKVIPLSHAIDGTALKP